MDGQISATEYADAVARFVMVAQQRTSGGAVAAQVLLSAYNGFDFQLDVAGMGSLDVANYQDALAIIRGRYETGREPHTLIPDGDRIFRGLWDRWFHLHVRERGKESCSDCDGRGVTFVNPLAEEDNRSSTCTRCRGKGWICACERS